MIILLCAGLLACEKEKELTFPEYYDCESTYQARVEKANADLTAKLITAKTFNQRIISAKYSYDSCINVGEGNK